MDTVKNSVMIIEDEPMNITALMHILGKDYTIYAEKDSRNSIDTIKQVKPDLILLDVMMPEIGGFDIIKKLKNDEETKDIPVIFVTGKTTPEDEAMGFSLGAVDYINKPFSTDVVKMRVRHQMQIINQNRKLENLQKS